MYSAGVQGRVLRWGHMDEEGAAQSSPLPAPSGFTFGGLSEGGGGTGIHPKPLGQRHASRR